MSDPNSDANVRNYVDETPLHLAAREGKLLMVQFLINQMKVELDADTLVCLIHLKECFRMDGLRSHMLHSMVSHQ